MKSEAISSDGRTVCLVQKYTPQMDSEPAQCSQVRIPTTGYVLILSVNALRSGDEHYVVSCLANESRVGELTGYAPCAICTGDPTAVHSFHMALVMVPSQNISRYVFVIVLERTKRGLGSWVDRSKPHNAPTMAQVTDGCMQQAMEIL